MTWNRLRRWVWNPLSRSAQPDVIGRTVRDALHHQLDAYLTEIEDPGAQMAKRHLAKVKVGAMMCQEAMPFTPELQGSLLSQWEDWIKASESSRSDHLVLCMVRSR